MKLISLNVERNLHTETVLSFLKKEKADIVCLQELLEEDLDLYKKELNLDCIYQAWSYSMSPIYPKLISKRQGIAIFAKNIVDVGSLFYFGDKKNLNRSWNEYKSNPIYQKNYALVWANIKSDDGLIYKFVTTHLPVTIEGESTPYQLEVADALLLELKNFNDFVICGDMNAPRGKETFRRLNKKYKDNIPLKYETSLDQKIHRVKGLQYMVDCLFTTDEYKATKVKLVDGVSDHMAIVAEITKK